MHGTHVPCTQLDWASLLHAVHLVYCTGLDQAWSTAQSTWQRSPATAKCSQDKLSLSHSKFKPQKTRMCSMHFGTAAASGTSQTTLMRLFFPQHPHIQTSALLHTPQAKYHFSVQTPLHSRVTPAGPITITYATLGKREIQYIRIHGHYW